MSIPNDVMPIEREEAVRRLYQLADRVEQHAEGVNDLMLQFKLSDIREAIKWQARWMQFGWSLPGKDEAA